MRDRLAAEMPGEWNSLCSRYVATRDKVLNEIKQIQGVEPSLSDHGPDHIHNVLNNAISLLSVDAAAHGLRAFDLYVLGMAIVFHDVGNLFGRKDHHLKIGTVFDWARGVGANVRREKTVIIRAAQAHAGTSASGGRDTLAEVDITDHLEGHAIQLRTIAAVLRLADELAEGPQRTTEFYRTKIGYDVSSDVFHKYAACTNVAADRANERIRLTYEIQLSDFGTDANEQRTNLSLFLEFLLHRVAKLDEERRYARFYAPILIPFKQTDVALYFEDNGVPLAAGVRFTLDDLVVPGESGADFTSRFPGKCKSPSEISADVMSSLRKGD